jgi:hypothetical protein
VLKDGPQCQMVEQLALEASEPNPIVSYWRHAGRNNHMCGYSESRAKRRLTMKNSSGAAGTTSQWLFDGEICWRLADRTNDGN